MWKRIRRWPLPARDALAIIIIAMAISCVAVPATIAEIEFRRNAQLIISQPKESATLVETYTSVRSEDTYYAQLHGEEVILDGGWFIDNPEPGTIVEVVQDPEKLDHVVVVGSPQSWTMSPWATVLGYVLGLIVAIAAAFFSGYKFLPERADPLLDRIINLAESVWEWFRKGPRPSN